MVMTVWPLVVEGDGKLEREWVGVNRGRENIGGRGMGEIKKKVFFER